MLLFHLEDNVVLICIFRLLLASTLRCWGVYIYIRENELDVVNLSQGYVNTA